jgi:hypothetical protein
MTIPAARTSTVTILISIVALSAVTYVQYRAVPPGVEHAIRGLTGKVGLLGVPLLTISAARAWAKTVRPKLAPWRNGLGLSSMFMVTSAWLFYAVGEIAGSAHLTAGFLTAGWTVTLASLSVGSVLIAVPLGGECRNIMIAAAVLMYASLSSYVYM